MGVSFGPNSDPVLVDVARIRAAFGRLRVDIGRSADLGPNFGHMRPAFDRMQSVSAPLAQFRCSHWSAYRASQGRLVPGVTSHRGSFGNWLAKPIGYTGPGAPWQKSSARVGLRPGLTPGSLAAPWPLHSLCYGQVAPQAPPPHSSCHPSPQVALYSATLPPCGCFPLGVPAALRNRHEHPPGYTSLLNKRSRTLIVPLRAKLGRVRPNSGRARANVGRHWPSSGQVWSNSGQIWLKKHSEPKLSHSGQVLVGFCRSRPKVGLNRLQSWSTSGQSGQVWSSVSLLWGGLGPKVSVRANSGQIRPVRSLTRLLVVHVLVLPVSRPRVRLRSKGTPHHTKRPRASTLRNE